MRYFQSHFIDVETEVQRDQVTTQLTQTVNLAEPQSNLDVCSPRAGYHGSLHFLSCKMRESHWLMKTKILPCLLSTSIKINLTIFKARINFLPFSSSFAEIVP